MASPRILVLGMLPKDFSPETHILLGPHALLGNEDSYAQWKDFTFEEDPFPTPEEICYHSDLTSKYANAILPRVAKWLAEVNEYDYPLEFWRLQLMPWLNPLVQSTWERQCRLLKVVEKYRQERLRVSLLKETVEWRFIDTLDFTDRGIFNPNYNEWLYARILENVAPSGWILDYVEPSKDFAERTPSARERNNNTGILASDVSFIERRLSGLKTTLRPFVRYLRRRHRCADVYGFGPMHTLFFSLLLTLKRSHGLTDRVDAKGTEPVPKLEWKIDFDKLLKVTLPVLYTQLPRPKRRGSKTSQKLNLMGPFFWYDEPLKLKMAQRVAQGERIIATQHGGNYGNARAYSLVAETEYKSDAFITWGWQKHGDYRVRALPLPSPHVTSFLNCTHGPRSQHLIMVGTRVGFFSYWLATTPNSLQQLAYLESKVAFLQNLGEPVLKEVLYRHYYPLKGLSHTRCVLNDKRFIQSQFPQIRPCDGPVKVFQPQLLKCKLVVLDHPGTTLNIVLAANVPTICFWDEAAWAMCRQAQPYFDSLKQVGILHATGRSAALKVNEIWDRVGEWWQGDDLQRARASFCETYARTSKTWWWEWARTLWKL